MNILTSPYIEHLNLVVKDMKQTLDFYQAAFPNWRVRGEETSMFYGNSRHWLHFGNEQFYLAFVQYPEAEIFQGLTAGEKMPFNHFGLVTDEIENLIVRLTQKGYLENKGEGSENIRKNSYFIDPNGYEIEFVEYLTNENSLRCQYL